MSITIYSPSKYIQGMHTFNRLAEYSKKFSKNGVLVLMDQYAYNDLRESIKGQFEKEKLKVLVEVFKGECCMEEIGKIKAYMEEESVDTVVGIGGGKVIDVAKAAAHFASLPLLVVPTTASTDGPCSSISVLYETDGTFKEYLNLTNSPNIVLVDTALIIKAPVRLFIAGMGDALSTYFETEACYDAQIEKQGRSNISTTALQLSRACLETLLIYGLTAKQDVERGECTEAVEKVIETIIYLSCIGFESGGLAAAHAIANALTYVPQGSKFLHGEKVAFGTFTQMLLVNAESELILRIRSFCKELKLPICLNDLNIQDKKDIIIIVKEACRDNQPLHNMRASFIKEHLLQEAMTLTNKMAK